jgi:hypothetical protein
MPDFKKMVSSFASMVYVGTSVVENYTVQSSVNTDDPKKNGPPLIHSWIKGDPLFKHFHILSVDAANAILRSHLTCINSEKRQLMPDENALKRESAWYIS